MSTTLIPTEPTDLEKAIDLVLRYWGRPDAQDMLTVAVYVLRQVRDGMSYDGAYLVARAKIG